MNGNTGLTAGDLALLRDNNGFMDGNGMWVFFLFFLLAWGGNGFFGNKSNESLATSADVQRGFDTNSIINKLDGIANGICDSTYSLNNAITSNANNISMGINNLAHEVESCCCTTNRNIDSVRYENAKNTCDIVNAIHTDGEATRSLITQNTIQELRDNLQAAQLQLGNMSQTQTLIDTLRPCAVPAYITCSPYTNAAYYTGCGCGNSTII